MFRKKTSRFIFSLVIGAVLLIVAFISFSQQKEERDTYYAIKNGEPVKATLFRTDEHNENQKNRYLYVFTAIDGKEYANSTIGKYSQGYESEYDFVVLYAVKGDKVLLSGGETTIDGKTYPLALSRESLYFKNNPVPSMTMCIVLFACSGIVFLYCLYNILWILFYKNVERKGILTYAIFIEANAQSGGSNRYMSIKYKYKDLDDNWIEASSPYTFTALTAERLRLMETFKIRYKGKFSMIDEDTKSIKI